MHNSCFIHKQDEYSNSWTRPSRRASNIRGTRRRARAYTENYTGHRAPEGRRVRYTFIDRTIVEHHMTKSSDRDVRSPFAVAGARARWRSA